MFNGYRNKHISEGVITMKKNVVWWPAIINEEHRDKYGNYKYFD